VIPEFEIIDTTNMDADRMVGIELQTRRPCSQQKIPQTIQPCGLWVSRGTHQEEAVWARLMHNRARTKAV
jgi:hypothetical protein